MDRRTSKVFKASRCSAYVKLLYKHTQEKLWDSFIYYYWAITNNGHFTDKQALHWQMLVWSTKITLSKSLLQSPHLHFAVRAYLSSSPAKSSPLFTFGEPLVKSTGFLCVKILEIWLVANRIFRLLSGHESMKTITSSPAKFLQILQRTSKSCYTWQWRHVCTSRTSVLKCGWHFDTLLPKYACTINSDWIITMTAGVFAPCACEAHDVPVHTVSLRISSRPEAWKSY
jgi:hypothetical protein